MTYIILSQQTSTTTLEIRCFRLKIIKKHFSFLCDKNKIEKVVGLTVLTWLSYVSYSQMLSHHCLTWKALPAMFPSWTNTFLFIQPGGPRFPQVHHIDDTNPDLKPLDTTYSEAARLQAHATTPSDN